MLLHPDDVEKTETVFQEVMKNPGIPLFHTARVKTKSGDYIFIEGNITNLLHVQSVNAVVTNFRNITKRIKAEENLRQSEAMMAEAQQIAHFGSWELALTDTADASKNSLRWSDEVFRIFGHEPGAFEVSYETFLKAVHPADQKPVREAVDEALATRSRYSIDHRIIRPDGSVRWVHEDANIVMDKKTGNPLRMIGTVQDISERKEIELALQKVEANFRNILQNTDTAYVLLDQDANILSYNNIAEQLANAEIGKSLQEVRNYIDLMPAARQKHVARVIRGVLKTGKSLSYETSYEKPGGAEKWLYVSMHPILNEEKKILGLSVAATDITDNKNAERQIRRSNERYELATRATNDIIWDWDIRDNKIYRSANYAQVFGYQATPDNMYMEAWINCIHPDDQDMILNSVTEKINNPRALFWEGEYRYFRKNGELACVHDRGYIVRDKKKKPVRMVGAMKDITEYKRSEKEKNKITDDLIQKNKDLEQFAYIVSHNLRGPLANIIGFSNVLQDESLDEETKTKLMNELSASVTKLDNVIKDLNHILQVKREINENKQLVKFSEIVSDIEKSIYSAIQYEDMELVVDFAADELFTVKSYVYSIFYNLISNSIKYRRPDIRPLLKISSIKKDNNIVLTFKDNGLGLDLEKKSDQVFGLYKRFHSHVEGKGMGLFMVKTQIENLGGNIKLKSKLNQGTEFTITFPI